MEPFHKVISYILNLATFVVVTILFVPSFFVVTYLQEYWSKKLGELFNF